MLTLEEQQKLKAIMEVLGGNNPPQMQQEETIDRLRDEQGRFKKATEESESRSVRKIRLVKVRGSYGTYLVVTRFSMRDILFMTSLTLVVVIIAKLT